MTAPKRMALAFGCMLLAFAIFGAQVISQALMSYGPRHARPAVEILPAYLLFTVPGWVLALPFILYFKNAEGWRAWAILVIGTSIGPSFILGPSLLAGGGINWQGNGAATLMALYIGSLTTVIYVLLLRRLTKKARHAEQSRTSTI